MARTRVLLGTSLIAGFLALLALDHWVTSGVLFHLLLGAVLVAGLLEFYALAERSGRQPLKVLPALFVAAFALAGMWVRGGGGLLLEGWLGSYPSELASFYVPTGVAAAVALSVIVVAHVVARDPRRWLTDAPATGTGLLYVWFLGAHALAVHDMDVRCLLVFIAVAKFGDAGAYFVGSHWGRHPLAPQVSPNKTVEGALGGLLASVLASLLVAGLFGLGGLVFWALFGLLVGGTAQLGDLVESALKRSADVKDSGGLLPQFGGVLDLIDSMILSAPVALWLLVLR